MPPDTILDCDLPSPHLSHWSPNNCHNIKQHTSAIESLADAICDLPVGAESFTSLDDTPDSYAGSGGMSVIVNGAEDGLEFATITTTDELVKVSANDTTAGYLLAKLAQGNGITLAEVNDGGDEDVSITVNQSQLNLANLGTKSHTALTDIGTNTHAQIDTHIASTSNPHTTTLEQARTAGSAMTGGVTNTVATATTKALTLKTSDNSSTNRLFQTTSSTDVETFAVGGKGSVFISPQVTTGTVNPSLTITAPAHTALTASTERNEILWNFSATQQFSTGAITDQRAIRIQAPTYGFVGASTITNAATVEISGAPAAGTNATITNAYALRVASGNTRLDGNLGIGVNATSISFPFYTLANQNNQMNHRIENTTNGTAASAGIYIVTNGAAETLIWGTPAAHTTIPSWANGGIFGTSTSQIVLSAYNATGSIRFQTGSSFTERLQISSAGLFTFAEASNMAFGTTTGTKIATGTTQKIGFWNATPVVQSTGWTITNDTPDKVLDCNATTLDEVADIVGTIVNTLKTYGLFGG